MSAHLMIVVGYMELPPAHKLTLMKLCDSADDRTRLAIPGKAAMLAWAGVKKTQGKTILQDLQEWGLLLIVERASRGRRTTYKVFPAPGDEKLYAPDPQKIKKGIEDPCPGVDRYGPVPAIPSSEEVEEKYGDAPSGKGRATEGAGGAAPKNKGPVERPLIKTAGQEGAGENKGPVEPPKGAGGAAPFGTSTSGTISLPPSEVESRAGAPAPAHAGAREDNPRPAAMQTSEEDWNAQGDPLVADHDLDLRKHQFENVGEEAQETPERTAKERRSIANALGRRWVEHCSEQGFPFPKSEPGVKFTKFAQFASMLTGTLLTYPDEEEIFAALAALLDRREATFPSASELERELVARRRRHLQPVAGTGVPASEHAAKAAEIVSWHADRLPCPLDARGREQLTGFVVEFLELGATANQVGQALNRCKKPVPAIWELRDALYVVSGGEVGQANGSTERKTFYQLKQEANERARQAWREQAATPGLVESWLTGEPMSDPPTPDEDVPQGVKIIKGETA